MESIIKDQIGDNPILIMILLLILFAYFVYKEYPDAKKRILSAGQAEAKEAREDAEIIRRLGQVEDKVDELTRKAGRDYARLNRMESIMEEHEQLIKESLQERRLLTTGILACLKGLKEQGCNGPVTEAIKEYEDFLVKKAHE